MASHVRVATRWVPVATARPGASRLRLPLRTVQQDRTHHPPLTPTGQTFERLVGATVALRLAANGSSRPRGDDARASVSTSHGANDRHRCKLTGLRQRATGGLRRPDMRDDRADDADPGADQHTRPDADVRDPDRQQEGAGSGKSFAPSTTHAGLPSGQPGRGKPPVTLGDKNFTEEYVLGELYAQALRDKGYAVRLEPDVGSSGAYRCSAHKREDRPLPRVHRGDRLGAVQHRLGRAGGLWRDGIASSLGHAGI